jgi:predicted ATPase
MQMPDRAVSLRGLCGIDMVGNLVSLMRETRMLTLIGPDRAGKLRVAHALVAHWRMPWLAWVDAGQVASLPGLTETISRAFALPWIVHRVDDLAATIGARRALLVLDNCDRERIAVAAAATELLGCCPRLNVIAHSGGPLGVPGERTWEPPQAVEGAYRTLRSGGAFATRTDT